MCGIFGISVGATSSLTAGQYEDAVARLFLLSESRGKEAAGLTICLPDALETYKAATSASQLIRRHAFRAWARRCIRSALGGGRPLTAIGHSRMVTNGGMEFHENNQPVIRESLVAVHNGIIVNDAKLWEHFPEMSRHYQVDTEVLLALLRRFLNAGDNLAEAARRTFGLIQGATSVAALAGDQEAMLLASNNGSMYVAQSPREPVFVFASEAYFLKVLFARCELGRFFEETDIVAVRAGTGFLVDLATARGEAFTLGGPEAAPVARARILPPRPLQDVALPDAGPAPATPVVIPASRLKRFEIDSRPIRALRRCVRCVLPETMPYIDFDEKGVCNYCRAYTPLEPKGSQALEEQVAPFRGDGSRPDCIVPISGGRDSSFCLHYTVRELGLRPVTYTYDWGMVTDLARRNISRLCGQLGVEHILISADIPRKRRYIRLNILAWLKKPHLGMIPLFMAGDKPYITLPYILRKQLGVQLIVYGANPMEKTHFKVGFCGVRPVLSTHGSPLAAQTRLASYYLGQYLTNPAYINASLADSCNAFFNWYRVSRDHLRFYNYIRWEEEPINTLLRKEYDWEVSTDTKSTWRIGDGTAAFYNYIYYLVAGFTENDTFRSNQIREGCISREEALEYIYRDNKPRFDSMEWYFNTVGLDMENVLERIDKIPRLYPPL